MSRAFDEFLDPSDHGKQDCQDWQDDDHEREHAEHEHRHADEHEHKQIDEKVDWLPPPVRSVGLGVLAGLESYHTGCPVVHYCGGLTDVEVEGAVTHVAHGAVTYDGIPDHGDVVALRNGLLGVLGYPRGDRDTLDLGCGVA